MTRADYIAALIVGFVTVFLVGGMEYLTVPRSAGLVPVGRVESPIVKEPFP